AVEVQLQREELSDLRKTERDTSTWNFLKTHSPSVVVAVAKRNLFTAARILHTDFKQKQVIPLNDSVKASQPWKILSYLAKDGEDLRGYNREDLDYIATHRTSRHEIICNRVTIENLRYGGGGNKWNVQNISSTSTCLCSSSRIMSPSICWLCNLFRESTRGINSKISMEEVLQWSQSFEKLMATKHGPLIYKSYLRTEYSDENIEFWLACEKYKKIVSQKKRLSVAQKLFMEYIQPQAPKEINIDSSTRDDIITNIQEPAQSCFDEAQKIVYMHMERDSYPRFLQSEIYQNITLSTRRPDLLY
ncbi:hypothetical protein lerEdw1_004014, partial [Lerista edwardsae]